jgi:arginyl-tRNA--protein-N-Asp/Glu arginylyltransferase
MIFHQYKDNAYVFYCPACKDVNRKLSVRVMTDQFFKREVRRTLAASGQLLRGPMRKRERTPRELGLMRELSLDAARANARQRMIDWDPDHRRSRDGKFELVRYRTLGNGACQIQMAVGGQLAPQMDDHAASREEYRTEEAYWTRVARASELMLHLYGDARNPLTPEESQQREMETY